MRDYIEKIRTDSEIAESFFAEKLAFTLGPVELKNMLEKRDVKLIDVRREEDFNEGHIPQAISIPKDKLRDSLDKLSKEEINIVYCYNQQCHLGANAALILAKNGYPTMELEGGIKVWAEDFNFELTK